jgi:hypothetical protein
MIQSCNSLSFALFHEQCPLQTEGRKNTAESNPEKEGAREWVPLLLYNDQELACRGTYENNGSCGDRLKRLAYSFDIVRGHHTSWRSMLSQVTSCLFETLDPPHHRSADRCHLVPAHPVKLASNTDVGPELCQPQNAIQFLTHGKHIFKNSKNGTELS